MIDPRQIKKGAAKRRDDAADDSAPAPVPATSSLTTLEKAARTCTACHLYKRATQTVFGEGPKGATFVLLGEQPGDQEDVAGKPFVGPAGKLLDRALEEAGIKRDEVYVTNTIKHFKWESAGNDAFIKNRIHAKSTPAGRGSKPSFDSLGRECSFALARPRPSRFSVLPFVSRDSGGGCLILTSRRKWWRRCIRRRCCGNRMKSRASESTHLFVADLRVALKASAAR